MNFVSRLIGGAGTPAPKMHANLSIPQQRLTSFKRAYNDLLQLWHNGDGVSKDAINAEKTRIRLRRLLDLLKNDLRGPTPHLCITFAATSQIFVTVSKVASSFLSDGIVHEALEICSFLIDCEEEDFLKERSFSSATTTLIDDVVVSGQLAGDTETESLMFEVLFSVASRIRLEPDILPTWFMPRNHGNITGDSGLPPGEPARITRRQDFPLFYLLLDHIAHNGRAGEFARMGVLYVIETLSRSEELERWVVEGDMATMMASGLGALYSQLSRKLILSYTDEEYPAILMAPESGRHRSLSDADETTSPDYQAPLFAFLAYLVFWQDLLEHCISTEIKQTLLDHFKILFLQQLLYPSLLESSNVDGGSSIAVLTYLRHILDSIDQPELVRSILAYLFGVPKQPTEFKSSVRPVTLARRRKSEILIKVHDHQAQQTSPELFTLLDLITTGLRSSSQQTVAAILQLCSSLLGKHHLYASDLVRTTLVSINCETPTHDEHNGKIDELLFMAEAILSSDSLEASYENHLHDIRNLLENHPCNTSLFAIPNFVEFKIEPIDTAIPVADSQSVRPRSIVKGDPFLECLLALMKGFFSNNIETNLALTQVFVDLSSCGLVGLGGWLLPDPKQQESAKDNSSFATENKDVATSFRASMSEDLADTTPRDPFSGQHIRESTADDLSPIFAALHLLADQVDWFREHVQGFTEYLQDRRDSLVTDGGTHTPADDQGAMQRSKDPKTSLTSGLRKVEDTGSVFSHLLPDKIVKSVSPPASARGRQQHASTSSTPTLVGHLGHLHIMPSRSPSQSTSRTYSPSPLRTSTKPFNFPKSAGSSKGYPPELQHKVRIISDRTTLQNSLREPPDIEASSVHSGSFSVDPRVEETMEVPLGHLLTNVIILQEFILELTAVIGVRVTMFNEVRPT